MGHKDPLVKLVLKVPSIDKQIEFLEYVKKRNSHSISQQQECIFQIMENNREFHNSGIYSWRNCSNGGGISI